MIDANLPKIGVMWAESNNGFIGMEGDLPWKHVGKRLKGDLPRVNKITCGNGNNAVLYGRNTLNSFDNTPLENRFNAVLSRDKSFIAPNGLARFFSYEEAMKDLLEWQFDEIWILGGKAVYEIALRRGKYQASTIIKTIAFDSYEGDVAAPQYDPVVWKLENSQTYTESRYKVETWSRIS